MVKELRGPVVVVQSAAEFLLRGLKRSIHPSLRILETVEQRGELIPLLFR